MTPNLIYNKLRNRIGDTILEPLNILVNENITDIATTIGSFVIRSIRGKFQRSISFAVEANRSESWMEDALYKILYKYNNIKNKSMLALSTADNYGASSLYYKLDVGNHNLKYRDYNILLVIQSVSSSNRSNNKTIFTIITYNLDPNFVLYFEKDMLFYKNNLSKIDFNRNSIKIYTDYHTNNDLYWSNRGSITKRPLSSIYLPTQTMKTLLDTINIFSISKEYYEKHGIAYNLKILLYGAPGPQPNSTLIPTPTGFSTLGNLKPGDYVFTKNGTPTKVLENIDKGFQNIYQIKFEDGRLAFCTIDHLWNIYVNSDDKCITIPLNYLMGLMQNNPNNIYSIPANKIVSFNTSIRNDYIELIRTMKTDDILPDKFLISNEPTRRDILSTIIDIYGNTNFQGTYINFNKNNKLARQILSIARSLGYYTTYIITSDEDNIVTINYLTKKHIDRYNIISITDINEIHKVCCIRVEDEEQLYLTEDFIVTHNTGKDSVARMIASEYYRNIYYIDGGGDGRRIPETLESNDTIIQQPLYIISDIDKFPYLINDTDLDLNSESDTNMTGKINNKQYFGKMINALDGILSGENRIIIMTTNHIDKFSPTFTRQGRIDLMLELKYVEFETFRKYIFDSYNKIVPENLTLIRDNITISELQFDALFLKMKFLEILKKYTK